MSLPPPALPNLSDTDRGVLESWRAPLVRERAASRPSPSPSWRLQRHALRLAALVAVLVAALAMALAALQPSLGLQLAPRAGALAVVAVAPGSPAQAAGLGVGTRLLALGPAAGGSPLLLEAADLIEDPDRFDSYAEWHRFYARQDQLAQLLRADALRLRVLAPGAAAPHELSLRAADARPLGHLPVAFWFLLLVQLAGLLTAGWVIAVYPPQPATHFTALAGLALAAHLACAAVFSTRELALPAALFHALSAVNHFSGVLALLGLAGVVTFFPTTLRGATAGSMALVAAGFVLWACADALWWLPSPAWAHRSMLVAGAGLVLLQMARQWPASAHDPQARAALRALAASWGVGLVGLIGLQEGVLLLGGTPPLPQAWLYGLVIVLALGAAWALRQVRPVTLADWALPALLTWGAGVGVLLCYRLLRGSPRLSDEVAMLAALGLVGLCSVPLTARLWGRDRLPHGPTPRDLASGILALGLTAAAERAQLWGALLERSFRVQRVELSPALLGAPASAGPVVLDNGRALWVPPVAGLPGATLWQRDRGARAFTRSDRRLAQRLSALAAQVIRARQAYVLGASHERERIADDLHDDLGAKLLSLLHASGRPEAGAEVARLAREALEEMRLSVRHLKAQPVSAADVLADWRAEAVSRLSAAGIEVDWDPQLPEQMLLVPVRAASQLTRVVREAVSNIIHHSGAAHCRVRLTVSAHELQLEVEDNGVGMDSAAVAAAVGMGLPGIERRVRRLGGTHRFVVGALGGTLLMVRVPLEPGADA